MTQSVSRFFERALCMFRAFLPGTDRYRRKANRRAMAKRQDIRRPRQFSRRLPPELIEQTIQLRVRNPEAFENSVSAMCAAVCDTFRPLTAADFVQKVNEDIRSEIELGKSKGRENGAFCGKWKRWPQLSGKGQGQRKEGPKERP